MDFTEATPHPSAAPTPSPQGEGTGGEPSETRPTTLTEDVVAAIRTQVERITANSGETYHSAFEAYGILCAALEDKDAISKDLKKAKEELWDSVKGGNDDATAAFLADIRRVARESAAAWISVAAIAKKAEDSL